MVLTLGYKIPVGLLHGSETREQLANDVAFRHFAFDIRIRTVTKRLDFELFWCQCYAYVELKIALLS